MLRLLGLAEPAGRVEMKPRLHPRRTFAQGRRQRRDQLVLRRAHGAIEPQRRGGSRKSCEE
jgi:hypothetical protein